VTFFCRSSKLLIISRVSELTVPLMHFLSFFYIHNPIIIYQNTLGCGTFLQIKIPSFIIYLYVCKKLYFIDIFIYESVMTRGLFTGWLELKKRKERRLKHFFFMLPLLNFCVSNAGSNGFKTILTLKRTESLPQNLIFYPLNSLQPNKIDL